MTDHEHALDLETSAAWARMQRTYWSRPADTFQAETQPTYRRRCDLDERYLCGEVSAEFAAELRAFEQELRKAVAV